MPALSCPSLSASRIPCRFDWLLSSFDPAAASLHDIVAWQCNAFCNLGNDSFFESIDFLKTHVLDERPAVFRVQARLSARVFTRACSHVRFPRVRFGGEQGGRKFSEHIKLLMSKV